MFSKITNFSEVIFLLGVIVFLAKIAYFVKNTYVKSADTEYVSTKGTSIEAAYTKSACIWDAYFIKGTYMHVRNACIVDLYAKDAWIEDIYISSISIICTYIKDTNTKESCIGATCTKSVSIRDLLTYTGGAYIEVWNINIRDDFMRNTCVKYIGGIDAVKHLEIYLWSS